jgi:hypothetical protein
VIFRDQYAPTGGFLFVRPVHVRLAPRCTVRDILRRRSALTVKTRNFYQEIPEIGIRTFLEKDSWGQGVIGRK